jgi:hypothetical protein
MRKCSLALAVIGLLVQSTCTDDHLVGKDPFFTYADGNVYTDSSRYRANGLYDIVAVQTTATPESVVSIVTLQNRRDTVACNQLHSQFWIDVTLSFDLNHNFKIDNGDEIFSATFGNPERIDDSTCSITEDTVYGIGGSVLTCDNRGWCSASGHITPEVIGNQVIFTIANYYGINSETPMYYLAQYRDVYDSVFQDRYP